MTASATTGTAAPQRPCGRSCSSCYRYELRSVRVCAMQAVNMFSIGGRGCNCYHGRCGCHTVVSVDNTVSLPSVVCRQSLARRPTHNSDNTTTHVTCSKPQLSSHSSNSRYYQPHHTHACIQQIAAFIDRVGAVIAVFFGQCCKTLQRRQGATTRDVTLFSITFPSPRT